MCACLCESVLIMTSYERHIKFTEGIPRWNYQNKETCEKCNFTALEKGEKKKIQTF